MYYTYSSTSIYDVLHINASVIIIIFTVWYCFLIINDLNTSSTAALADDSFSLKSSGRRSLYPGCPSVWPSIWAMWWCSGVFFFTPVSLFESNLLHVAWTPTILQSFNLWFSSFTCYSYDHLVPHTQVSLLFWSQQKFRGHVNAMFKAPQLKLYVGALIQASVRAGLQLYYSAVTFNTLIDFSKQWWKVKAYF